MQPVGGGQGKAIKGKAEPQKVYRRHGFPPEVIGCRLAPSPVSVELRMVDELLAVV